jgi:hypothetical protein
VLTDRRDSEVGSMAWQFLRNLALQEARALEEKIRRRKEREATDSGEAFDPNTLP